MWARAPRTAALAAAAAAVCESAETIRPGRPGAPPISGRGCAIFREPAPEITCERRWLRGASFVRPIGRRPSVRPSLHPGRLPLCCLSDGPPARRAARLPFRPPPPSASVGACVRSPALLPLSLPPSLLMNERDPAAALALPPPPPSHALFSSGGRGHAWLWIHSAADGAPVAVLIPRAIRPPHGFPLLSKHSREEHEGRKEGGTEPPASSSSSSSLGDKVERRVRRLAIGVRATAAVRRRRGRYRRLSGQRQRRLIVIFLVTAAPQSLIGGTRCRCCRRRRVIKRGGRRRGGFVLSGEKKN